MPAGALVLFLLSLAWSPGPGNVFFAMLGARFVVRATLNALMGCHLTTRVVTVVIGLGFTAATTPFCPVFDLLRLAGATWVSWLAARLWHAGAAETHREARPAGFVDGVVRPLLGHRTHLVIMLTFTQFLPPKAPALVEAAISVVFTLNNFAALTTWTLLGDGLIRISASERSARGRSRLFAVVLAGVAIWIAGRRREATTILTADAPASQAAPPSRSGPCRAAPRRRDAHRTRASHRGPRAAA